MLVEGGMSGLGSSSTGECCRIGLPCHTFLHREAIVLCCSYQIVECLVSVALSMGQTLCPPGPFYQLLVAQVANMGSSYPWEVGSSRRSLVHWIGCRIVMCTLVRFRMKTPKYLIPRGNKPLLYDCIIKLATEISLFSLQISKTWCFVQRK